MLAAVGRFVAWLWTVVWRYTYRVISAIVSWVWSHVEQVYRWIISAIAWDTIVRWIRDRLNI